MTKKLEASKKKNEQVERNLLIWGGVSLLSWAVYVVNGGTLFGLWADITIIVVAIWIFRYTWQRLKPAKGWNAPSVKAGMIAVLLCVLWLVVLGLAYTALPKSTYFN